MANVELQFLGQPYCIPSELKEYVTYLQMFEGIHGELIPLLTKQMQNMTYSGGADEDFVYFKHPLTKVGEQIITILAESGIYDVTIDDLVSNNEGFIQLHNICTETISDMAKILLNAMDEWLSGYENAQSSAASKITGSGFGIITNQLSSLLIYSAVEASTLKKQEKLASEEYTSAMQNVSSSVSSNQERSERDVLIRKYYPGVAAALNLFVSTLMEVFVTKLEEQQIFNYSLVKKYNLARSSELLKNLPLVSNKSEILKQAFLCCPYNPDVYQAVLDTSLEDIGTFETAKYFMQDKVLLSCVERQCEQSKDNLLRMRVLTRIWTLLSGEIELNILIPVYIHEVQAVRNAYKAAIQASGERFALVEWIKSNLSDKPSVLCSLTDELIESKLKQSLSDIVADEKFAFYCQTELISLNQIALEKDSANSLDEVNRQIASSLASPILGYLKELRAHRAEYLEKANAIKPEFENAQASYRQKCAQLSREIQALRISLNDLGAFAFIKKNKLNMQIQDLTRDLWEYEKDRTHIELQEKYQDCLKQADSFI